MWLFVFRKKGRSLATIDSKSASGPDGITKKQAVEHCDWLLPKHLDAIHKKKYRAPASRRSQVSKVDWEEMTNIVDRLKIVNARIRIPYGKLRENVMV